ncbi:hypothetical protein [Acinetobacter sp. P8-3-8]|uniref:phage tail fiber protein n=1 Tax=Acinetobacter sp. P8-3-8 TaxID=1029823 RepID=UPI0002487196|nr:hypothetical protein [Acinetobacter sp. P8-3-8]
MTIQTVNLGTAPSGAGGDTFRSTGAKMNENFTNNSHAASRLVGTATGNVMEVGAFGLGGAMVSMLMPNDSQYMGSGNYYYDVNTQSDSTWRQVETNVFVMRNSFAGGRSGFEIGCLPYSNKFYLRGCLLSLEWRTPVLIRHSGNTSVDSNGFIKAASPIIKLLANKIESNEEALEQEPIFEKVDVGHYLLKNTEGFSDDGWYIEMPKDANGNVLVAVQYQQIEDNTIEVKTFVKKFDEETGDIVPNLEKPRDIPAGRWIDIRLKALPQPEIEITNTPADFQPTNLAQAVAEALKNDAEQ